MLPWIRKIAGVRSNVGDRILTEVREDRKATMKMTMTKMSRKIGMTKKRMITEAGLMPVMKKRMMRTMTMITGTRTMKTTMKTMAGGMEGKGISMMKTMTGVLVMAGAMKAIITGRPQTGMINDQVIDPATEDPMIVVTLLPVTMIAEQVMVEAIPVEAIPIAATPPGQPTGVPVTAISGATVRGTL